MKNLNGMASGLSEIILKDAQEFIERELDEALQQILLKARVRALKDIVFEIREDQISDRMVMTLQIRKKGEERG